MTHPKRSASSLGTLFRVLRLRSGLSIAFASVCLFAMPTSVLFGQARTPGRDAVSGIGAGPGFAEDGGTVELPEPAIAGRSEIALRVVQFGTGQVARSADWFGLQVEVVDSGAKPRNVLIRLSMRDPDGDIGWVERTAVINPGIKQTVWLYARMPGSAGFRSTLDISAHEAVATGNVVGSEVDAIGSAGTGVPAASQAFSAGRLLGRTRYPIVNLLPSHVSTWAIIGDRPAGLEQFAASRRIGSAGGLDSVPPDAHLIIELARGLILNALPDRWMGLAQFDLIAWTASSREQPSQLTEFQAGAIREWVRRGGHLVVVMPQAGQPWIGAGAVGNPLADLMPTVAVTRVEGVDLEAYRPMLTRMANARLPSSATVHRFRARADSDAFSAIPILAGPDGEAVVVRRLVGVGSVTLVGIDVASPALSDSPGSLQSDIFWNRIIGNRSPVFSPSEIVQRESNTGGPQFTPRFLGGVDMDAGLGRLIQMQGQAAAGLLLAFFVFGAYWLIAGPVSYFGLKAKGKRHHSWLAFAGATATFTLVAWLGATLLKGRRVEVRHVTILDHVYGQSNQRARSWLNLYFPTYGDEAVRVLSSDGFRNALSTWDAPEGRAGGSDSSAFPDARGYPIDARWPDTLRVPIRATAKQFQADWAGVLGDWGMPRPILDERGVDGAAVGAPALGSELRVLPRTRTAANERDWRLQGRLSHNLPGPVNDVMVIVNLGQNAGRARRIMFADAFARRVTSEWKPGVVLDLSDDAPPSSLSPGFPKELSVLRGTDSLNRWLELSPFHREQHGFMTAPSEAETKAGLVYLSFHAMMDVVTSGSSRSATWIRRHATHGFDLSRWMTQPCIIIIGRLEDVPCPVPITVDGRPLPAGGRSNRGSVLVRWIYPLPANPPAFIWSTEEDGAGAPAGGEGGEVSGGSGQ